MIYYIIFHLLCSLFTIICAVADHKEIRLLPYNWYLTERVSITQAKLVVYLILLLSITILSPVFIGYLLYEASFRR